MTPGEDFGPALVLAAHASVEERTDLFLERATRAPAELATVRRQLVDLAPAAVPVVKAVPTVKPVPVVKAAPARKPAAVVKPAPVVVVAPVAAASSGKAATVVAYGRAQVGKRYVYATAGPNTFDCSGLVKAAYARVGISLPHQTGALIGRGRAVPRSALQPGDLVFPSSSHVGIYIGGGRIVHASTPKTGVKESNIYSFHAARRIL